MDYTPGIKGEPEAVAQAIYEHYKPLNMSSIPASRRRAVAWALADKARHACTR